MVFGGGFARSIGGEFSNGLFFNHDYNHGDDCNHDCNHLLHDYNHFCCEMFNWGGIKMESIHLVLSLLLDHISISIWFHMIAYRSYIDLISI